MPLKTLHLTRSLQSLTSPLNRLPISHTRLKSQKPFSPLLPNRLRTLLIMERNHLFDRLPTQRSLYPHQPLHHHQQHQQQPWMMMMSGQQQLASNQDSPGLYLDQGFEDLFRQMDLSEKVHNLPYLSDPRMFDDNAFLFNGESLVPRTGDGVCGLGFGSVYNGFYNPVENHFSGNFESYHHQRHFYQPEVERVQMNDFPIRRNNNVPSRGHFSQRNGLDLVASDHPRRVRGNRSVLANNNVALDDVNLMDLRGQILALATDQLGCKMLQMKFGDIREEEIDFILDEVTDKVSSLMTDQFGNHLVQKLVEVCSEEQMTQIINSVTKIPYQLIRVCLNSHGTRTVQKLLEHLTTEQQISMVISALCPGVVALIKDANAYHVIQHCLRHFPDEHRRFLINEIARNCYEIATDKSGCCVVQLCVEITNGEVKQHLVSEITANALQLSEDRYGNYVVQLLLLMKLPHVASRIVNELQGHFFFLSCNKFGSNVVERCLIETSSEYSDLVILELLKTPGVSKLLQDPYGNYVIQSALSVSQGLLHNALVSLVERYSASMCSNLYGKKILAWFSNGKQRLRLVNPSMCSRSL